MRNALGRFSLPIVLCACARLAHAEIAVIMAPGSAPMSKAQVANVYMGRSFELRPLDLPDSSPIRASFYKAAANADAPQVRSVWSRLMFTGRGEPPRELPDAAAVKRAVAANPRVIGYIDAAHLDSSVKAVLVLP